MVRFEGWTRPLSIVMILCDAALAAAPAVTASTRSVSASLPRLIDQTSVPRRSPLERDLHPLGPGLRRDALAHRVERDADTVPVLHRCDARARAGGAARLRGRVRAGKVRHLL